MISNMVKYVKKGALNDGVSTDRERADGAVARVQWSRGGRAENAAGRIQNVSERRTLYQEKKEAASISMKNAERERDP